MADYFDNEPTDTTEEQEIEEVKASAPPPSENSIEPKENTAKSKEITAERIEIANKNVIQYLLPRENRKTHFTLNDANIGKLTSTLESIPGYNLTVDYADKKDDPGVTLLMNGETVGKIHFLLCDAPNVNLPDKYYCKLYFYEFKNQDLYDKVKSTLINFFENFNGQSNTSGGKRAKYVKKHVTKKRLVKRKSKKRIIKKSNKRTAKRN